jgi:lipopolysaccharide transport system permease protein
MANLITEPQPPAATPANAWATTDGAVRHIAPVKRRVHLRELWTSRHVAKAVAMRDLKVRYKQSLVGPPWLVLQPLGMLAGLALVFSGVADVDTAPYPYVVFALVSMAGWICFQNAMLLGTTTFLVNAALIRRVVSPRTSFITSSVLASLVAPSVVLAGAVVAVLVTGNGFPLQALASPAIAVALIVFVTGLTMLLASISARYRDVASILPFLFQAGLLITPVGYSAAGAPDAVKPFLAINPMTGFLEAWRWSVLGTSPQVAAVVSSAIWTVVVVVAGWRIFTRMEVRFADYL